MKTEHDWIVRVYDPQNSIVTEYIIENRTKNQAAGEAERDFEVMQNDSWTLTNNEYSWTLTKKG
jgi:hypothetical protein